MKTPHIDLIAVKVDILKAEACKKKKWRISHLHLV
ncbi:hypothetical protein PITCH_A1280053 [uncultured Desulfobacterium sp.]|uniref:Uncharacterized protein n=1 Tax=uncultured Desulfobacterium sp. TaxID=201089 RepID=A0A445MS66_9BACT|nr:hypothetical protein PITCH_A1280053 [uncultured Desulfobacterium sp.]